MKSEKMIDFINQNPENLIDNKEHLDAMRTFFIKILYTEDEDYYKIIQILLNFTGVPLHERHEEERDVLSTIFITKRLIYIYENMNTYFSEEEFPAEHFNDIYKNVIISLILHYLFIVFQTFSVPHISHQHYNVEMLEDINKVHMDLFTLKKDFANKLQFTSTISLTLQASFIMQFFNEPYTTNIDSIDIDQISIFWFNTTDNIFAVRTPTEDQIEHYQLIIQHYLKIVKIQFLQNIDHIIENKNKRTFHKDANEIRNMIMNPGSITINESINIMNSFNTIYFKTEKEDNDKQMEENYYKKYNEFDLLTKFINLKQLRFKLDTFNIGQEVYFNNGNTIHKAIIIDFKSNGTVVVKTVIPIKNTNILHISPFDLSYSEIYKKQKDTALDIKAFNDTHHNNIPESPLYTYSTIETWEHLLSISYDRLKRIFITEFKDFIENNKDQQLLMYETTLKEIEQTIKEIEQTMKEPYKTEHSAQDIATYKQQINSLVKKKDNIHLQDRQLTEALLNLTNSELPNDDFILEITYVYNYYQEYITMYNVQNKEKLKILNEKIYFYIESIRQLNIYINIIYTRYLLQFININAKVELEDTKGILVQGTIHGFTTNGNIIVNFEQEIVLNDELSNSHIITPVKIITQNPPPNKLLQNTQKHLAQERDSFDKNNRQQEIAAFNASKLLLEEEQEEKRKAERKAEQEEKQKKIKQKKLEELVQIKKDPQIKQPFFRAEAPNKKEEDDAQYEARLNFERDRRLTYLTTQISTFINEADGYMTKQDINETDINNMDTLIKDIGRFVLDIDYNLANNILAELEKLQKYLTSLNTYIKPFKIETIKSSELFELLETIYDENLRYNKELILHVKDNIFPAIEQNNSIILIPYGSRTKNTSIFGSDLECVVIVGEENGDRINIIQKLEDDIRSLNIKFYKAFNILYNESGNESGK